MLPSEDDSGPLVQTSHVEESACDEDETPANATDGGLPTIMREPFPKKVVRQCGRLSAVSSSSVLPPPTEAGRAESMESVQFPAVTMNRRTSGFCRIGILPRSPGISGTRLLEH